MGACYVVKNKALNRYGAAAGYVAASLLVFFLVGLSVVGGCNLLAMYFGAPPWVGFAAAVVPLVGFAVLIWICALRDFRTNISGEVTFADRALVIPVLRGNMEIPFVEIASLRLRKDGHQHRLLVRNHSGQQFAPPKWIASSENIADALEATVIPAITRGWEDTFGHGLQIEIRENRLVAFARVIFGLCLLPIAILFILSIKGICTGFSFLRDARVAFYNGCRGMLGPLTLDSDGLQRRGDRLAWEDIESISADDYGAMLVGSSGERWRVSAYVDNFLPLHYCVASRLRLPKTVPTGQLA